MKLQGGKTMEAEVRKLTSEIIVNFTFLTHNIGRNVVHEIQFANILTSHTERKGDILYIYSRAEMEEKQQKYQRKTDYILQ